MTTSPVAKVCRDCVYAEKKQHYGGYNFKCTSCRERLLQTEPCKLMREILMKSMRKWGETLNWQTEPHCGCMKSCKRRQYQKG